MQGPAPREPAKDIKKGRRDLPRQKKEGAHSAEKQGNRVSTCLKDSCLGYGRQSREGIPDSGDGLIPFPEKSKGGRKGGAISSNKKNEGLLEK